MPWFDNSYRKSKSLKVQHVTLYNSKILNTLVSFLNTDFHACLMIIGAASSPPAEMIDAAVTEITIVANAAPVTPMHTHICMRACISCLRART